jgi:predicted RNase H-like nuclease
MWVAGVDGCRAGWFVILRELGPDRVVARVLESFSLVARLTECPSIVAVDIPIGLLEHAELGGRECDRQAWELLGWPRRNSVFSPPVRSALLCNRFEQACATNAGSSPIQSRTTRQCFGLFPKLREVDELMSPGLQGRIREVHPEVCFFELNGGRAMLYGKRTARGVRDRIDVLMNASVVSSPSTVEALKCGGVGMDDVLDALVACWTAERIHIGTAFCIPQQPTIDSNGLRMEMWRWRRRRGPASPSRIPWVASGVPDLKDYGVRASREEVARRLEGNWQEDVLVELQQAVDSYHFAHRQMQECDGKLEGYLASLPARMLDIPAQPEGAPAAIARFPQFRHP